MPRPVPHRPAARRRRASGGGSWRSASVRACASRASRASEHRLKAGPSHSPVANETPNQAPRQTVTHHPAFMSASLRWGGTSHAGQLLSAHDALHDGSADPSSPKGPVYRPSHPACEAANTTPTGRQATPHTVHRQVPWRPPFYMPLGGCPSRGGFRGLACFPATPRSRQIAQPSITPTTTAGVHQAAKPISAHHHGLIPTPSGTSDCGHWPCPNHHTTGHASPLRPNPLRIPNDALAPGAVPH
jgi:hypothetical protein